MEVVSRVAEMGPGAVMVIATGRAAAMLQCHGKCGQRKDTAGGRLISKAVKIDGMTLVVKHFYCAACCQSGRVKQNNEANINEDKMAVC